MINITKKAVRAKAISFQFLEMLLVPVRIKKSSREARIPARPARDAVKTRAENWIIANDAKRIFALALLKKSEKAKVRGIVKTKYDASQLGWPRVEKMRSSGLKSACQQPEVSRPVKIK